MGQRGGFTGHRAAISIFRMPVMTPLFETTILVSRCLKRGFADQKRLLLTAPAPSPAKIRKIVQYVHFLKILSAVLLRILLAPKSSCQGDVNNDGENYFPDDTAPRRQRRTGGHQSTVWHRIATRKLYLRHQVKVTACDRVSCSLRERVKRAMAASLFFGSLVEGLIMSK